MSFSWLPSFGLSSSADVKAAPAPTTIADDPTKKGILERYKKEFDAAEAAFMTEINQINKQQRSASQAAAKVIVENRGERAAAVKASLNERYHSSAQAATERNSVARQALQKRIEEMQKIKEKTQDQKDLLARLTQAAVADKKALQVKQPKETRGLSHLVEVQTAANKPTDKDAKVVKPVKPKPLAVRDTLMHLEDVAAFEKREKLVSDKVALEKAAALVKSLELAISKVKPGDELTLKEKKAALERAVQAKNVYEAALKAKAVDEKQTLQQKEMSEKSMAQHKAQSEAHRLEQVAAKQAHDRKPSGWEVMLREQAAKEEAVRQKRHGEFSAAIQEGRDGFHAMKIEALNQAGNTKLAADLAEKRFVIQPGYNFVGQLGRLAKSHDVKAPKAVRKASEAGTVAAVLGQMHAKVQHLYNAINSSFGKPNFNREDVAIQSRKLAFYLNEAMARIAKLDVKNDLHDLNDELKKYRDLLTRVQNVFGHKAQATADLEVVSVQAARKAHK